MGASIANNVAALTRGLQKRGGLFAWLRVVCPDNRKAGVKEVGKKGKARVKTVTHSRGSK